MSTNRCEEIFTATVQRTKHTVHIRVTPYVERLLAERRATAKEYRVLVGRRPVLCGPRGAVVPIEVPIWARPLVHLHVKQS